MLKSGHCCDCGQLVWRTATHPVMGVSMILWPDPTSVYAQIGCRDGLGIIPGVCYCHGCAPSIGVVAHGDVCEQEPTATTVIAVDLAPMRYGYHFTSGYGEWLRAWLHDELRMDEAEIETLVRRWMSDQLIAQLIQKRNGD